MPKHIIPSSTTTQNTTRPPSSVADHVPDESLICHVTRLLVQSGRFRFVTMSTMLLGLLIAGVLILQAAFVLESLDNTGQHPTAIDPRTVARMVITLCIAATGMALGVWSIALEYAQAQPDRRPITNFNTNSLVQSSIDNDVTLQASIVLTTDLAGTITSANDAFCVISGFSREELIGSNCRIVNSGYHNKEFFTSMYRAICNGEIWKGEICNRNKNGSIYWVDTTIVPLKDESGKIVQFYSVRVDITKQKEVENDLKLILDALPSIVICKDEQNIIHRINRAGAQSVHRDPAQIEQHNAMEFFANDSPFASFEDDLELLANGRHSSEIIETTQDDLAGCRTLKIDKIPILDSSGFFSKLVTIATDITEVAEMKQRLSFAIESTNAGIWDWDVNSKTLHTNELYFTMLGDAPIPSPIPSGYYFERMHEKDLNRVKQHINAFVQSGELRFHDEFRVLHNDGMYRWIKSNAMVIETNADGSAKRVIGQHHDIDSVKRLDLAIRTALELKANESQHETLYKLCEALADSMNTTFAGVSVFGEDDKPQNAQLVAGSLQGKPIEPTEYEIKGSPCEHTLNNNFCYLQRDVANEYPNDSMLETMNAQGYAGLRLDDSAGKPIGIIMVVHDSPLKSPIDPQTALKLFGARASVELEYRRSADLLKAALNLAESSSRAKSEFIANMSHEIRTPMTAILGNADILADYQTKQDELSSNAIGTIRRNGEHLLTIINDILDISKIEAGKMKPHPIDSSTLEILRTVEQLLADRAHEKGLRFEIQFPTKVPAYINTDPIRLRQILLNLVGNAIKFTESGSITLNCSVPDRKGQMLFEVLDTGIGLSPRQCEIIFESFTQADSSTTRQYGGSGLGLKISATLVNLLGGTLQVESEPGIGSRFWFTIDIDECDHSDLVGLKQLRSHTETAVSSEHARTHTHPISLHGYRVLLVEDGPDNQTLISHHLQRAGASVNIAENGQICLETLSESNHYDLVLMDMQMPVLDGYQTTEQIRARGFKIPIIALTAHAMSGDRERCLAVGCDEYHPKPINKAQLIELCSRVIDQHRSDHDQDSIAA